jgi:acetyl-CoA synthetase
MADEPPTPVAAKEELNEVDHAPVFPPPSNVSSGAHVSSMEQYRAMYERSIADPEAFWAEMARENITWFRDFSDV